MQVIDKNNEKCDFNCREELDELSVKQLKEILMLNRVDFKGCCEKSELLERVQRLWNDLQSCPGKAMQSNFKLNG